MFKNDLKTRQEIKRLRKISKKFPLLFARIGECYMDLGDLDTAERILLDGLRKHPDYLTGYLLAGECCLYQGHTKDAEEITLKGLEKAPSHLGLLNLMQRIKKQKEEFEDLEKVRRSIRILDPLRSDVGGTADEPSSIGHREWEVTVEQLISPTPESSKTIAVPDHEPVLTGTETPPSTPSSAEEKVPVDETLEITKAVEKAEHPAQTLEDETVRQISPQSAEETVEKPISEPPAETADPPILQKTEPPVDTSSPTFTEPQKDASSDVAPAEPVIESTEDLPEAMEPEEEDTPETPVSPSKESEESEEERETAFTSAPVESEPETPQETTKDNGLEVIEKSEIALGKPPDAELSEKEEPKPEILPETPDEIRPEKQESVIEGTVLPEEPDAVPLELKTTAEEGKTRISKAPDAEENESTQETHPHATEAIFAEEHEEYSTGDITQDGEENATPVKTEPEVESESPVADEPEETEVKKKPRGRLKKRLKELTKLFAEEEGKDAFGLPLDFNEQSLLAEPSEKTEISEPAAGPDQKERTETTVPAAAGSDSADEKPPQPKKPKIATKTLGELYATQKKYDEAIEIYEKLIEKDPTNEAYIKRLAELKKRRSEALG
jgi:tetratricopeptide (TPR) repeat protein